MRAFAKIFITFSTLVMLASCAFTPKIRHSGFTNSKPINELKKIKIGGVDQWMLIRSENSTNPVLLFIHGGPGTSEMPLLRHYNKELEKHYTVVMWDQRGAGKSNHVFSANKLLNLNQLVDDAQEVTQYLKTRFNQPKVFLMGHSWGSILGILSIKAHPENYYAYVGIGQVVNTKRNLQTSYDTINILALRRDSKKEITKLAQFDAIRNLEKDIELKDAIKMHSWIGRNARIFYTKNGHYQLSKTTIFASEFSILDKVKYFGGIYRSTKVLWDEHVLSIHFDSTALHLEVPVYFFQGQHDFLTCANVTKEYCDALSAPHKEVIMFQNSAHCPIFEEPKKFNELLISKVRKHATSQPPPKDMSVNATN